MNFALSKTSSPVPFVVMPIVLARRVSPSGTSAVIVARTSSASRRTSASVVSGEAVLVAAL